MNIQITVKYIVAFLALTFVLGEAHEIVHTSVGRFICGAWGERDFNAWGLYEGCSEEHPIAVLSTFAGPIFTFIMMWVGVFLLGKDKTRQQKSVGFALVFASMPFARLLTAAMGAGDEVYALNIVLGNYSMAWTIGLSFIILITTYPLYKGFMVIENKRKIAWFLLFFLAPTFIYLLVVLVGLNTLLANGVLSEYWILGSPIIVTIWTIFVTVIYLLMRKNLYDFKT